MGEADEVPLFPLKTVLFPGGDLALRIFEPRYLDMIGMCLRAEHPFGVLCIEEGSETGAARTASIGTLADIVDWRQEVDGLLGITVVGRERFEALSVRTRDDRLNMGVIRTLPPEPGQTLPAEYVDLARVLQRILKTAGHADARREDLGDATWVGYRLAELLPLTLADRQACLQMEDPVARLAKLRSTFN